MLWHIIGFEFRCAVRRRSTWIHAAIYFVLAFLIVNLIGGAFGVIQGSSDAGKILNSPILVAVLTALFSIIGTTASAALIGGSGARDFEYVMDPLVFTTAAAKSAYLGGRFLGSMAVTLVVLAAIPVGLVVGALMPYLEPGQVGPFRAAAYWRPFALLVLPNVVITGTFFFSAAVLTRRVIAVYVGAIALLLGYFIALPLAEDIVSRSLGAVLDPFGMVPLLLAVGHVPLAEQHNTMIPFGGILGLNRLVWLAVAALAGAGAFTRFRVTYEPRAWAKARPRDLPSGLPNPAAAAVSSAPVPPAQPRFTAWTWWSQLRQVTRHDLADVTKSRSFFLFAALGLVLLVTRARHAEMILGTPTYPTTQIILGVVDGPWWIYLMIVITVYAGELVWRDRALRVDGITNTLPIPVWVSYGSRLMALTGLVVLLLLIMLAGGVLTQALNGYYHFELSLYLGQLFGFRLIDAVLAAVLALAVHVLVNHKYLGHGVTGLLLAAPRLLPVAGLDHHLYRYGSDSGWLHSAFDEYGQFLWPWVWWKVYWGAFALLLMIGTMLFWIRGSEAAWLSRLAGARKQFTAAVRRTAFGAVVVWAGAGGWIFYNTNVLNQFETDRTRQRSAADYERVYKRFDGTPQPRVVAVSLRADLFPDRREVTFRGRTTLRNKTAVRIDSVQVLLPVTRKLEVRRLGLSRPAQLVLDDPRSGYRIFRLAQPLEPGDSTDLLFDLSYRSRGFANDIDSGGVVANGTLLHSDLLPHIGYDARRELDNETARRRQGLSFRILADDPTRRAMSDDADWIRFDATVATNGDQIAVAPGRLVGQWHEGDRRVFHYVQDAPVDNRYVFLSARYAVLRDRWHDVAIEILYHPAHAFNVQRMAEAAKQSLAYFSTAFGPYPHRVLRIVEFPRYREAKSGSAVAAEAFATTIPFSESFGGFLARSDSGGTGVDYPFLVVAHEIAHQWWGYQVVTSRTGGPLLEILAQYSALMTTERTYGRSAVPRILQYALDGYLRGRASNGEAPLSSIGSDQLYIAYDKGLLAMYALQDLIGETATNAALARYVAAVRFQPPPYTNAQELLAALRAATPDSLRYVIDDSFEKIVLYNNQARTAVARPAGPGSYWVTLDLSAQKVNANGSGKERPASMDDLVDVGVYGYKRPTDRKVVPLYLAKHRIHDGNQRITVAVHGEPIRAGIDPEHKLIDRIPEDNTVTVTRGAPVPARRDVQP